MSQVTEREIMSEVSARLFKTADFHPELLANNPGISNELVRIVFHRMINNPMHSRIEPVFRAYYTMDEDSFIGYFYQSAFKQFCL